VAAGQIVQVRVLEVDVQQKRISLSMKKESQPREGQQNQGGAAGQGGQGRGGNSKQPPKKPVATMAQLKEKFAEDSKMKKNNMKLAFSVKSLMRSGR